jgi:hypothetical protein
MTGGQASHVLEHSQPLAEAAAREAARYLTSIASAASGVGLKVKQQSSERLLSCKELVK